MPHQVFQGKKHPQENFSGFLADHIPTPIYLSLSFAYLHLHSFLHISMEMKEAGKCHSSMAQPLTGSTRCRNQHPPQQMPAGTWSSCSCTGHSSGLMLMLPSAQQHSSLRTRVKSCMGGTAIPAVGCTGVCPSPAQKGVREHIHILMLGVFMLPAASTDSHVK